VPVKEITNTIGMEKSPMDHQESNFNKNNERNCVRVGVVGLGYWGPKLVRNFYNLPIAKLQMVADLRKDRLNEIVEFFKDVTPTQRYKDLLESDIDAIVIATPVNHHFEMVKEALLAGKHVLVEKPITANSTEAQELQNIAKERSLVLMVGHTFVYNPAVEAVRAIIQSGEIGDIYYLYSTRVNLGLLQPDINVIWDLAPHDVSIANFVLDSYPATVSAHGACYVNNYRKLHEVAYIMLNYPDGIIANIHLSWLDPVKQRRLTIVGSKKMLVFDDIANDKVVVYDKRVEVPAYSVTEAEFHASYHHGNGNPIPIEWEEPLKVECRHFLNCILTMTKPRSSAEEGVKVVKVLETAQRSLLNHGVELIIEY
jgi:predicted dehydrogenase